ncbi:MAG: hypothetical protein H5U19_14305 [Rhodobacteraceae bacterium]|nr:hypothetical protein [Paracoccaceae bacterium]
MSALIFARVKYGKSAGSLGSAPRAIPNSIRPRTTNPAHCIAAQSVCNTTPVIYGILSGKHGESPAARGMTRGSELLEMWANRDTGSWSLLITRPDGITCLVQAGQNFDAVPAPPNL